MLCGVTVRYVHCTSATHISFSTFNKVGAPFLRRLHILFKLIFSYATPIATQMIIVQLAEPASITNAWIHVITPASAWMDFTAIVLQM